MNAANDNVAFEIETRLRSTVWRHARAGLQGEDLHRAILTDSAGGADKDFYTFSIYGATLDDLLDGSIRRHWIAGWQRRPLGWSCGRSRPRQAWGVDLLAVPRRYCQKHLDLEAGRERLAAGGAG